jgi:hypothetical protein
MAKIFVSTVIKAPADRLWARLRDFNALPLWVPPVGESRIENGEPADKISCVRALRLRNGDELREQLLGLSDYEMFCTYSMLETPMPLTNYIATFRVTPVTDGNRSYMEWLAEFDCAPDVEANLVSDLSSNVFQASFDGLKRHFGG